MLAALHPAWVTSLVSAWAATLSLVVAKLSLVLAPVTTKYSAALTAAKAAQLEKAAKLEKAAQLEKAAKVVQLAKKVNPSQSPSSL